MKTRIIIDKNGKFIPQFKKGYFGKWRPWQIDCGCEIDFWAKGYDTYIEACNAFSEAPSITMLEESGFNKTQSVEFIKKFYTK